MKFYEFVENSELEKYTTLDGYKDAVKPSPFGDGSAFIEIEWKKEADVSLNTNKGLDAELICYKCGKTEHPNHFINASSLWREHLCFGCNLWRERLALREDPTFVVAKGSMYTIGDENSKETYFRGFGGHKVIIKFFDGREVVSTNLWHGGEIPPEYREQFPDNAELIWN